MKKAIRIPAIIGSNGKWAAWGYSSQDDVDWAQIDEMADPEHPLHNQRRVWITVEIDVPETLEVTADHVEEA